MNIQHHRGRQDGFMEDDKASQLKRTTRMLGVSEMKGNGGRRKEDTS